MEKLELTGRLLHDGLNVQFGEDVLRSRVYGASRYRADFDGATHEVSVQWALGAYQYEYLRAFVTSQRGLPFLIDLIGDVADFEEYTAYLIPGSLQLVERNPRYIVTARLEIEPSERDTDYDALLIAVGATFGEDGLYISNLVDRTVNVVLPEIG